MGSLTDSDADFPDAFCNFLQRCVANVDAAELLLTLHKEPQRAWHPSELCAQLAPIASLSEADVQRYLDVFESRALVTRDATLRARYRAEATNDAHVAMLERLYVERPVTLFRVIYALRDSKINTFSDAFKLWR